VSAASAFLAAPREIALDSSGNVYVLDRIDRRVAMITPNGEVNHIGRAGSGPGEFSVPLGLGVDARGRIHVFDYQRQSVQTFSSDGVPVTDHSTEPIGIPSRIVFAGDGSMAYAGTRATGQGGLVVVLDSAGRQVSLFGSLVSPHTQIPPDMLEQLHQGILPDFMRNNALPAFTTDGGSWLFLQTEGILQRYAADGTLRFEHVLSLPEMESIRKRFFDWYGLVTANDLLRYFEYVDDAVVTDDKVWLLWRTPELEPGLITVHDESGRMTARLVLPGLAADALPADPHALPSRRRMGIDPVRLRLYIIDQSDVTLLAFSIPDGVLATSTEGR
jgi:hypothetical protein